MKIHLENTGKRFNRDWIFRNLTYDFTGGKSYAIIGPNGSGKSTLLQVLASSMDISEGKCSWKEGDQEIPNDQLYQHLSIAAPYLEITEEMTALEFLKFHATFKPLMHSMSPLDILEEVELKKAAGKQIRFFSSGMKQRIKLAQAVFSDVPILLLDEPCTNFDEAGYALYHHLISTYCNGKLVIISTNDLKEYHFCNEQLLITRFK